MVKAKEPTGDAGISKILGSNAVAKIKKDWGDTIFTRASEMGVVSTPRIPTGIFNLDYALGGGFPVGRVNVVWGHKSASKTTTFLHTIANAQKMCAHCWHFAPCNCGEYRPPVCAFLDVEGTLDLPWAARIGVDLDNLLLSVPEYAEQTLDIGETVVREGVDILVIDSIAFLTPHKEIEQSVAQETVGLQARLVGKGTRKFVSAINARKNETGQGPTLLFTNQVRMKVGVMFGSPETQPGGMAHGFAASTETRLSPGKFEMDDVLGKPISASFGFKVDKNKVSEAKMEGEFKMCFMDTEYRRQGQPMNEADIISWGERVGLVEGGGSAWSALGEKYKSKSLIEKRLVEEPDYRKKLGDAVMSLLLNK